MTWKVFVLFYLARAESFVSGKIPFLPSGVAATFIMVAAVAGMDPLAAPPLAAGDWLGATSCLRLPKPPRARRRQAFGHIGQLVADRHLCSFRRRLAAERRAVVRCAPHCLAWKAVMTIGSSADVFTTAPGSLSSAFASSPCDLAWQEFFSICCRIPESDVPGVDTALMISPFIVLTETKFSLCCIPVGIGTPYRTRV